VRACQQGLERLTLRPARLVESVVLRPIIDVKDSSVRTLSEQFRQAIATSGVTRYEIAKATGVSQSTLSKFMLRQRGISIEAMDAVGLFLSLRLTATHKKRTQSPTTGAR
jgi:hypothetical protein